MDIYDFHDNDEEKLGEGSFDWEEAIGFGIATIILFLSIVGLVTVIRIFI